MVHKTADTSSKRKRKKLTADRIAETAINLIDEVGLDNFSFRTLAHRLGCQAMSIYHYYPSKAHLYEALVVLCLAEIPVPPIDLPWRERLRQTAHSIRKAALDHPGFFLYLAIFRMNNHAGLDFLNHILRIFEELGCDPLLRARQFRTLSYYIMGAGLDEAMGYAHGPSAVEPVPSEQAAREFPAIMAVGPYFGEAHHAGIFDYGLELMLDRFEVEAKAYDDS